MDDQGSTITLKNNILHYASIEFSQAKQLQATDNEDIMQISARLIQ